MSTSTEAGLVVWAETYDEIMTKLAAAGYHHCFGPAGPKTEWISMSGIRLLCGPEKPPASPRVDVYPSDFRPGRFLELFGAEDFQRRLAQDPHLELVDQAEAITAAVQDALANGVIAGVARTDENERREIYGTSQKRIVTLEDRALDGGVSIIVVDECNTTQAAVTIPWEALHGVVKDLGVRGAVVHLKRTADAG
jgi:hypothetical protein